jgi:hypothetical protein
MLPLDNSTCHFLYLLSMVYLLVLAADVQIKPAARRIVGLLSAPLEAPPRICERLSSQERVPLWGANWPMSEKPS